MIGPAVQRRIGGNIVNPKLLPEASQKKDRIMAKLRRGFRVRVPVQLFYSRFFAIQPRAPLPPTQTHLKIEFQIYCITAHTFWNGGDDDSGGEVVD